MTDAVAPKAGMTISIRTRRDVVVVDPDRFLAAARQALRDRNSGLTEADAAEAAWRAALAAEVNRQLDLAAGKPADDLSRPFVSCHASLEGRSVQVLDGASVIRHVAEELRAPPHLG